MIDHKLEKVGVLQTPNRVSGIAKQTIKPHIYCVYLLIRAESKCGLITAKESHICIWFKATLN